MSSALVSPLAQRRPSVTGSPYTEVLKELSRWDGQTPVDGVYRIFTTQDIDISLALARGTMSFKFTYPVLSQAAKQLAGQVGAGQLPYDSLFSDKFLESIRSSTPLPLDVAIYSNVRFGVYYGEVFDRRFADVNEKGFKIGNETWLISYEDLQTVPNYRVGFEPLNQQLVEYLKVLNYLARPPIPDSEILLMSNAEVFDLYYGLRKIVNKYKIEPNPVISNGLYRRVYAAYEKSIQTRIYNLRTDLRQVDVGGETYTALVKPNLLDPPDEPNSSGVGIILTVASFIPVIGIAVSAYQAAMAVKGSIDAANMVKKYGKIAAGIGIGVGELKNRQDIAPIPEAIEDLKKRHQAWQDTFKTVAPYFDEIFGLVDTVYGIERVLGSSTIIGNGQQYDKSDALQSLAAKYLGQHGVASHHWSLYEGFFYSDRARRLVTGESNLGFFDQLLAFFKI